MVAVPEANPLYINSPPDHPCTLPCHAPSACPETDPCQSLVTLTCPCGRIRQSVQCGKTLTTRGASQAQATLKCSNDCQIAKRNARLADALGINSESRDKANAATTYTDDLVAFAKANPKFLPTVERAFADFFTSEKRTQVLPHMPPDRRKFVHDLAVAYRMDAQMVDQEPHRSVQLVRRVDSRIPRPLLSAHITTITPSYGKLADFRSLRSGAGQASSSSHSGTAVAGTSSWRTGAPTVAKPPTQATASRGWTSVVAASPAPTPASTGAPSPYSWGARPASTLAPAASSLVRLGGSGHSTPVGATSRPRTASPVNVSSHFVTPPSVTVDSGAPVPDSWEDDA
ncbi:hypothetical protein D9619_011331 [Psilocybe cf. subviscida]|uniref:R3H domain-containing protein n=1 Tax=Psilocybe cf. subviscida TaxID=2480587 RepID=A0A8H5BJN0_9AGAR|nr:hypothetical protein D9619_011331 [Psilocybe cf. subviscida]